LKPEEADDTPPERSTEEEEEDETGSTSAAHELLQQHDERLRSLTAELEAFRARHKSLLKARMDARKKARRDIASQQGLSAEDITEQEAQDQQRAGAEEAQLAVSAPVPTRSLLHDPCLRR
jgi:hypothetical protein